MGEGKLEKQAAFLKFVLIDYNSRLPIVLIDDIWMQFESEAPAIDRSQNMLEIQIEMSRDGN